MIIQIKENVLNSNSGTEATTKERINVEKAAGKAVFAGTVVALDKVVMFLAILLYRIGWWSTIYCQQILLGMLTIFGPIQWAFSFYRNGRGLGQNGLRGILQFISMVQCYSS